MKKRESSQILLCLLMLTLPLLCANNLYAQSNARNTSAVVGRNAENVVTGVVLDQDGEPLAGASIRVKNTKNATGAAMADADGKFSVKIPKSGSAQLIVSYIGMSRKEVKVQAGKPVTVVLEPDATQLSEVTVVDDGYNKLPRRDMVGAYTTIKAEDIMMPAYQSIDQMLQGKVAGMIVENSSTRVGASPRITIRGTSTLLGNTDPLWVVDGVIQPDPLEINSSDVLTDDLTNIIGNQVSWLNPMDIETITVLKDASATAIYGSKASNGVIVITTKKGNADRISVRYTGNVSVRMRSTYDNYNYMNSRERIQFSKEAYDAGCRYIQEPLPQIYTYEGLMAMFNNRKINADQFAYYMERLETGNTDWLGHLTRNSVSNSHNLSISGGTSKITYNASVGYSSNNGTEKGNDNTQFTSRLNVGVQFNKRLRATVSMNGSIRNSNGYSAGVNPGSYALTMSRAIPLFEEDGERAFYKQYYNYKYAGQEMLQFGYNIFNEMENSYSKNSGKSFQASANLDFKLFEWLTYQFSGSIVQSINDSEAYAGEKSAYIEQNYRGYPAGSEPSSSPRYKAAMLPYGGQLTTRNSSSTTYAMAHKFQFSKQINDNNRINALLGFEIRSVNSAATSNTVWGYIPERGDMLVSPSFPNQIVPMPGVNSPVEWGALDKLYKGGWRKTERTDNYLSYFGTIAYSWMNRYVVNANMRSDASNRFGQDTNHRFNPTYSFGFSWRMAEEPFIKNNLWWLNQVNLSATYGIQGNVVNSVSPELIASYNGIKPGYDEYFVTISSLPNPYLKWESTKTWNLGLAMQLFNKYTMNVSYYGRRSNAIINQEIAHEYGLARMRLNGGMISNQGIEFTFNFTPFQSKDIAWTLGFNCSKNWNTSQSPDQLIKANVVTKSDFLSGNAKQPLKKGYPLTAFWSYSFAGLDPTNGYPLFNYMDVEKYDDNVDPTTFLVYSGSSTPYFTGGINTRLRYKDFSIGTSFTALLGTKRRLPNPYSAFTNGRIPDPFSNLSKDLLDRWKQPGDEKYTIIPALYTSVLNEYNMYTPDGLPTSRYMMWAQSDARVADASFLRCSQISASYYLPKSVCSKFGAQSCSFTATVNNIFVIASKRWNGFDPETGSSRQPHIYAVGLSVSF